MFAVPMVDAAAAQAKRIGRTGIRCKSGTVGGVV